MSSDEAELLEQLVKVLVERRRELKHSQEAINFEVGVADRLLPKWEVGMKRPSLRSLMRWCDVLDMQITIIKKGRP